VPREKKFFGRKNPPEKLVGSPPNEGGKFKEASPGKNPVDLKLPHTLNNIGAPL